MHNLGYMPDKNGFTCPTLDSMKDILDADPDRPHNEKWAFSEYGMNSSNIGTLQRETGFNVSEFTFAGTVPSGPSQGQPYPRIAKSQRVGDVFQSTRMIYFTDTVEIGKQFVPGQGVQDVVRGSNFVFDYADTSTRLYGRPHARHNLSINTTFVDGHAEAVRLTAGETNPRADAIEMYGTDDPTSFEDNELSDARYHDENRWTIDGNAKPGQL
jgi:prepilin-type processing-associated H-X9-DG protein